MTTRTRSRIVAIALLLLTAVAGSPQATPSAPSLDELRASGTVGEGPDGLVVVRDAKASDEVKAIVAGINDKRLAIYQKRAAEQNTAAVPVTVADVGQVYAKKIFDDAPVGTWFRAADGKWSQKPAPAPAP